MAIGNIKIQASAIDFLNGNIDHIDFYVDGILRETDSSPPFNWIWRLSSHIKHKHMIKIIAYDKNGNSAYDELEIWKFL